jgi:GNAT superfamily N-acetyltransferase
VPLVFDVQVLDIANAAQVARCFRVFSRLRPHLTEAQFIERVRVQAGEGYAIALIEAGEDVAAAAGYRVAHFLAWGRVLYVDDLITDPDKRGQGLGGALMDWLLAEAANRACDELHLDTGFGRHDAHRLYLNKGLQLSSHHMSAKVG